MADSEKEALAAKLKQCREYLGLSQEQVAKVMGWHRPTVSYVELGQQKVTALDLAKLARLYQRPLSWFLTNGEPEPDMSQEMQALCVGLEQEDRNELELFADFLWWRKKAATETA